MPTVTEDFFHNPVSSLVTVKCSPWTFDNLIALIGDAAHAIVPFFGQGMNCGFEDCVVLDSLIPQPLLPGEKGSTSAPWKNIFREFEHERKKNSDAIAQLAVQNFVEMRDLVTHPDFVL